MDDLRRALQGAVEGSGNEQVGHHGELELAEVRLDGFSTLDEVGLFGLADDSAHFEASAESFNKHTEADMTGNSGNLQQEVRSASILTSNEAQLPRTTSSCSDIVGVLGIWVGFRWWCDRVMRSWLVVIVSWC